MPSRRWRRRATLVDEARLGNLFVGGLANAASGWVCRADGDTTAARRHLDTTTAPMEMTHAGLPIDEMRNRLLLAELALDLQDTELARVHLEGAAVSRAYVADAGVLGDQLDELEGRLAETLAGDIRLSQRELELLPFLPTHLTDPQIAAQVQVSVNTVRAHLRHIYRKLGVSTRAEAVERCGETRAHLRRRG